LLPRPARLQVSSPGGPAAAATGPSTGSGIGSPLCALAWPQRCRGDDADDDADRDPGRRPAERRGDGGFGARPNDAGEQLERGRDAARARQQQWIEQVEVGRRLPGREQQHNGDQSPDPGERDELIAERARQVGGGRLREDRVVVVMPEPPVALVAKQPAHLRSGEGARRRACVRVGDTFHVCRLRLDIVLCSLHGLTTPMCHPSHWSARRRATTRFAQSFRMNCRCAPADDGAGSRGGIGAPDKKTRAAGAGGRNFAYPISPYYTICVRESRGIGRRCEKISSLTVRAS
jgi:hypothetical protein